MKSLFTTAMVVTALVLGGCGGGGGSASAGTQPPEVVAQPEPAESEVPSPTPEAEANPAPAPITATSELVLSNDFSLQSHTSVEVSIDINSLDNSSGYLSICSVLNTDDANSEEAPDYKNCFVRTAIPASAYEATLDLSTAEGVAYSAIWFLDLSREPVITRHDLTGGSIQLTM